MQKRKPVLTLLHSNTSYDFSSVVGHKNEINAMIQKTLDENEKRVSNGRMNFRNDNRRIESLSKIQFHTNNIIEKTSNIEQLKSLKSIVDGYQYVINKSELLFLMDIHKAKEKTLKLD